MELRVLGPLEARVDGVALPLGAPKQQIVLAMLAVNANHAVSIDELIDEVWYDHPPPVSAVANIGSYTGNLRRLLSSVELGRDRIRRVGGGYLLRAQPDELDLLTFRGQCRGGQDAANRGEAPVAAALFSEAAGLWTGPVLAGLRRGPTLAARCAAIEAERLNMIEHLVGLHLALGQPELALPLLRRHVHEHPLRERAHALLIRALYDTGDLAAALAAYATVREALIDDLGVEPGPDLRRLHHAMLNRQVAPFAVSRNGAVAASHLDGNVGAQPRELPAEAGHFVGRQEETIRAAKVLAPAEPPDRNRPAIAIVSGIGGVGKSALAVHVAHLFTARYPDGQLYVNLRGASPGLRPLTPGEALHRLLRSLGVAPEGLPQDEADAAARLRSETADGRYLFLLDNAVDADQVEPLLPSSRTCAVLITARRTLATLDADLRVCLGALSRSECIVLIQRLTANAIIDPATAESIVASCGHLPLAVRIAAGRLLSRPDLSPTDLAGRLANPERRLDELELEGLAVRSCIRVGYDALASSEKVADRNAAKALRALGLFKVPSVDVGVVAAMLPGSRPDTAQAALDQLVSAQLLTVANGRYWLHDLVRLVAAEIATEEVDPAAQVQMLQQGFAYYADAVRQAGGVLSPRRGWLPTRLDAPPTVSTPALDSSSDALAWIDAELLNLVAAAEQAGEMGSAGRDYVVRIIGPVDLILYRRNERLARQRLAGLALEAAVHYSDREVSGWAHLVVGRSEADLGNVAAAMDHLERALAELSATHSTKGIALTLNALGIVAALYMRDPILAVERLTEGLAFAQRHELPIQADSILLNLGILHAVLGQWETAREQVERALIGIRGNDRERLGALLGTLAAIHCYLGNLHEALQCVDEAVACSREVGDRRRECHALLLGAEVHVRTGDHHKAGTYATAALSLARTCDYAYAEAAALRQRAKIAGATGQPADALLAEAAAAFADTPKGFDLVLDAVIAQRPHRQGRIPTTPVRDAH